MIFTFIAGMLASLFGSTSNGTSSDVPNSLTVDEHYSVEVYGGPDFFGTGCSQEIVSLDAGEPALKSEDKKWAFVQLNMFFGGKF